MPAKNQVNHEKVVAERKGLGSCSQSGTTAVGEVKQEKQKDSMLPPLPYLVDDVYVADESDDTGV